MTCRHDYAHLEEKLGYHFCNAALLKRALTHCSYSADNNERLEFLGDALLNYVVANLLFDHFKREAEGQLSKMRAALVNQDSLAKIALSLNLGYYLRLGKGEIKAKGYAKPSILSDALEALFAAISIDSSSSDAHRVIAHFYQTKIKTLHFLEFNDAKSMLQEILQAKKLALPHYQLVEQSSQAHQQIFEIECRIDVLQIITRGQGNSRKQAEQRAANLAMQQLSLL